MEPHIKKKEEEEGGKEETHKKEQWNASIWIFDNFLRLPYNNANV